MKKKQRRGCEEEDDELGRTGERKRERKGVKKKEKKVLNKSHKLSCVLGVTEGQSPGGAAVGSPSHRCGFKKWNQTLRRDNFIGAAGF